MNLNSRNVLTRFVLICVMVVSAPDMAARAEDIQGLVLVADVRSQLPSLTRREIRRAYLGASVVKEGQLVRPLVNLTDENLHEVFLQKVMYMSSPAYQRQLMRKFIHAKGHRPTVYRDRNKLFDALSKNPGAVTYIMWDKEAKKHPDLKVVEVLWDGKS